MWLHLQQIEGAFPAPVAAGEPQGSRGQGRGLLWQQHGPGSPSRAPLGPPAPAATADVRGRRSSSGSAGLCEGQGNGREGAESKRQPEAGFEI